MRLSRHSALGGLAALILLSACAADVALVSGLPMTAVRHAPDGATTVMTGKINPKMDYSSTFSVADGNGLTCEGSFSNAGVGSMTCSNGFSMNLTVPPDQYGKFSGAYIEQTNGIGVAVGWGSKSDATLLEAMFPAR